MNTTTPSSPPRVLVHHRDRRRIFRTPGLVATGALAALIALGLAGCGGGDPPASDTTQPLEGRHLSKAGQLTGTWMRLSPGEFVGFEFLKDGKVLATLGSLGRTTTLDYSVLDGGRLSLVAPGGATTVFATTIDGDLMELSREGGAGNGATQRFRRVPSGQTLAAAVQEHAAALEAERQRRHAALAALLAADDLVVTKSGDVGPAAVLSLKIDHRHSEIGGTLVMDDDPARDDPLRPVRLHPVSGSIAPLDAETDRIRILLNVHPATAPAGQQDIEGRIELIADGPVEATTLSGGAEFPKLWIGRADVVLRRDGRLHGAPVAKMEQQLEALRRAMAQVGDPLGGRAVLTGTRAGLGGSDPQPVSMTIERITGSDRFTATVNLGTREGLTATGELGTVIGRGALYVTLSTGEQWRMHVDEAGRIFAGPWRPNTRADFISSGNIELTLGRVWTAAEVAAERAAIERFLTVDLRTPKAFTGFVSKGRGDDVEHWPVWVELQTAADGTASGRAWLLGQGVGVELTGRLSGGTLQLNTARAMAGSATSRTLAQQRWQLEVTAIDPQPRLGGTMSATMGGSGTAMLAPVDPAATAEARRAMIAALQGGVFTVVNTTISRRPEPAYFRFQVDEATGAITGDAVGADLTGSTSAALPPGLIQGTIAEDRGHVVARLTIEGSPEPVRKRDQRRFEFTLVANTLEDDLLLTGWDPPGPGNQAWLRLTPVAAGAPVVVSEEQQLRLAAHRLGARTGAPDQPTPGAQAIVIVHATDRDARVGQIFTADGRYSHGNSIATAALHAGVMTVGETAVVRLTYGAPFTAVVPPVEKNGVRSSQGTFRANNTVPTFTIERVPLP